MKNFFWIIFLLLCSRYPISAQKPYVLNAGSEISLLGGSFSLGIGSFVLNKTDKALTPDEISLLQTDKLNCFDRSATKNWSPKLAKISDAVLMVCIVAPSLLFLSSEGRNNAIPIGVMGIESMFLTTTITSINKTTFRRIRPYAYHPQVPLFLKTHSDAKRSFFSGHTSLAFASAMFTSTVFSDLHPDSPFRPYVWGSTMLIASGVGYLRFAAGKHFPTDIITGAIVGCVIGKLIPELHKNKQKSLPIPRTFQVRLYFPF